MESIHDVLQWLHMKQGQKIFTSHFSRLTNYGEKIDMKKLLLEGPFSSIMKGAVWELGRVNVSQVLLLLRGKDTSSLDIDLGTTAEGHKEGLWGKKRKKLVILCLWCGISDKWFQWRKKLRSCELWKKDEKSCVLAKETEMEISGVYEVRYLAWGAMQKKNSTYLQVAWGWWGEFS